MSFAAGSVFGHYRIESLLGRGGMGAVFLATDEKLGRRVALKLLSPELSDQPAFRDRFIAESRTAASLDHPHVVPVFEAGDVDGQLFIAMRHVSGTDLDQVLRREGPLSAERAVRIVAQVADALDAAHRAGLIHRDVKPGNILIASTSRGEDHAYLSDFGLTKQAAYGAGVTRTGQVVGTVDYVAPEQIEGRPIGSAVDIYSLGCVLYELLSGSPPYRRDSELATLYAHVQAELPSVHAQRAELPEALDAVIARAVAKDPADRFETATQFASAAAAAISGSETAGEMAARGFLFADLRGYTDFVERRGDDVGAQLLDRYRRMVREVVSRQRGSEVRTEGDSFYVLFPTASRAVSAGLEIVAEAARQSESTPDAPIKVGVGVHAGETAETAEGPVGSAVNLAARICAQAQPGEVLVSETVRGLTRTRQVAAFEPVGNRRLKGIAEPMPLFRALAPGTVVSGGRRTPATTFDRLAGGDGRGRWLVLGATGLAALAILVVVGLPVIFPPTASPSPSPSATAGAQSSPTATSPAAATATTAASATAAPTPTPFVPTGSRIVYSRQLNNEAAGCDELPDDAKLYVLDPDDPSAPPYRLTARTNVFEYDPVWSADGAHVGFVPNAGRGPGGLAMVGPAGEPIQMLLEPRRGQDFGLFWRTRLSIAPDGSAFVHAGDEFVWRTEVGGSGQVQIAGQVGQDGEEPPPPTESFGDLRYLSDGSLILHSRPVEEGGVQSLDTMAADGSGRQRLLDLSDLAVATFAVAADDDRLAFVVLGEDESSSLLIGRLSGGLASFVDFALEQPRADLAVFSPDGSRLAFQAGQLGAEEIYVLEIETGEVTQLTDEPDSLACHPAWHDAPFDLVQPRSEPEPGAARPFELGKLGAGLYHNDVAQPPIELTFPDGWFARRSYVDGLSLWRPDGPLGEVDYARVQFGADSACGEEEPTAIGDAPGDLLTFLQARSDLAVSDVGPINLSGFSGITFTVVGIPTLGCLTEGDPPEFEYWSLFPTGEDNFSLGFDEGLRMVSLEVRGATRSFLIFTNNDDLDAYWTNHARPLLQTADYPQD